MSHEQPFKQNEGSEDMMSVPSMINDSKENKIISVDHKYLNEVIEKQDDYFPESIKEEYVKKINSLHNTLLVVEGYLSAKEEYKKLAHQVSEMMMNKPVSGVRLTDKMAELQKYNAIIDVCEQGDVPEKVLAEAKLKAKKLNSLLTPLLEISHVARETPDQN